ncbi:MAG: hypothetical protein AAB340_00795 [Patescibacteria group bacterium]
MSVQNGVLTGEQRELVLDILRKKNGFIDEALPECRKLLLRLGIQCFTAGQCRDIIRQANKEAYATA